MREIHNCKNQYFSVLGDSISTLDGYHPQGNAAFYAGYIKYQSGVFAPEDTWWGQVIDALGAQLLINDSFSACTVCRHPACEIESYGCSDVRTSRLGKEGIAPDVVMVLMGINDWGCGLRLMPTEACDAKDLSIFSVAYATMLQKLRLCYPDCEIWCLTLPWQLLGASEDEHTMVRAGQHIQTFNDVIRACSARNGCRLISLDHISAPMETVDGRHPTAKGMRVIAKAVLRELDKGNLAQKEGINA